MCEQAGTEVTEYSDAVDCDNAQIKVSPDDSIKLVTKAVNLILTEPSPKIIIIHHEMLSIVSNLAYLTLTNNHL